MNLRDFLGPSQIILVGAIIVAIGGFWSASKTQHFQQEVKVKNAKIEELNSYILSTITGGDSYCFLELPQNDRTKNMQPLFLVQKGKYPLYDVYIRMVNLDDPINPSMKEVREYYERNSRNVGNMIPNEVQVFGDVEMLSVSVDYNIFIIARNGSFLEKLRLRFVDGEWRSAIRLTKTNYGNGEQKIILEKIEENYPKVNGAVIWDRGGVERREVRF